MVSIPELQQKFNGQYKLTRQRKIIFHTLTEHTGRHLSAEDIYELVRRQHPEIGVATIYRTLELFGNLGIVQKLEFGDGRHRYELGEHLAPQHHHMICVCCGKVMEGTGGFPEKIESGDRQSNDDFLILDYRLYIYGYCKACQAKCQD
jgi:Fe2+/Zn2+ uptake regulation proteins